MIKRLQLFGILLLVIGLSVFVGFKISWYRDAQKQQELFAYFDKTIETAKAAGIETDQVNVLGNYSFIPMPYAVIATLDIDSVNMHVSVIEGVDNEDINIATGHFPQTQMPWERGGNFAVAGHSSISHYMLFNNLHKVKVGDEIRVQTIYGAFIYVVTDTRTIDATDVSVLNKSPDGKNTITLLTCTNRGKQRLCVTGELKSK